ncbi:MAG TPA: transposase [Polyangiaceae bacterium]|nr:transposase [Polyangiaceae bacterium]
MAKLNVIQGWNEVRRYLPVDYESLAAEHRQVETKFGNAKIRDADTLLRFILLHVGANLPLRQTVTLMAEAGLPELSPMRLHKKMCRAAPYLQSLVQRLLGWSTVGAPERWGGFEFSAVDATVVCGPGAIGTDARIHTKLRLADVSLSHVEVTDDAGGESFCRFDWNPGELAVGDRGYCSARGVEHVVNAGADVLVRYRIGSMQLVDEHGHKIDVLEMVRNLSAGDMLDLDVCILRSPKCIDGRLVVLRLDRSATERAQKRARKEYGSAISAQILEAAGYVILFTTASRERLTVERCLQGYRLRWQVELQFKRWKSLCNFDCLPNQRDDTILSWLYAKVLLGVLLDRMASIPTEVFPPNALRQSPERYVASDVVRSLESDEHLVPPRHCRADASRAA